VGSEEREREFRPRHPEILLSIIFLFRPLYDFFRCKTVKKLGKVTVLQRKKSLAANSDK